MERHTLTQQTKPTDLIGRQYMAERMEEKDRDLRMRVKETKHEACIGMQTFAFI